jgi:hypothetical protein
MSMAGVTRELLVRYLDTWAPTALQGARRATFVQAWADGADVAAAEAALRVFAEFADRLRGRRLSMIVVGAELGDAAARLEAVQAELGTPPELSVHTVAGGGGGGGGGTSTGADLLTASLSAVGAAGAPLLVCADGMALPPLRAIRAGRPGEVILLQDPGTWPAHRRALRDAGFELTAGVELVDSAAGGDRLLGFATTSAKHLEVFKDALWAVDEYAGIRYRDPQDPEGHLLDISLSPHPGPLRRELLTYLGEVGECSMTELRRFAMTETVYRASDTLAAVTALLAAGAVTRSPERGRLGGDVLITAARGTGSTAP